MKICPVKAETLDTETERERERERDGHDEAFRKSANAPNNWTLTKTSTEGKNTP